MVGWLRGMLPETRRFEFQEQDSDTFRTGGIDLDLDNEAVATLHKTFLDKLGKATFRVTQVGSNSRTRRYLLLRIEEIATPPPPSRTS